MKRKIAVGSSLTIFCLLLIGLGYLTKHETTPAHVVINEIMSSNGTALADRDFEYPDWIELYNPTEDSIDLSGYELTKKKEPENGYIFSNQVLKPGEYLIIYASGKGISEAYPDHAPFRINNSGEKLYLFNQDREIVDELYCPDMDLNESYGYAKGEWHERGILTSFTPGYENADSYVYYSRDLNPPSFSAQGGFYHESFLLSLSSLDNDCDIYYTLDGSDPDENSKLYTDPIFISNVSGEENRFSNLWLSTALDPDIQHINDTPCDKALVVKARCYKNGVLSREIATNTYFTGLYYSLPVVSFTADTNTLFDEEDGAYVVGKYYNDEEITEEDGSVGAYDRLYMFANYVTDEKVAGCVEIYDEDGCFMHENIHMKFSGTTGPTRLCKSMRIFKKDGSDFENPPYSDDALPADTFLIRGTGGELGDEIIADSISQKIMQGYSTDTLARKPCVLFINGEYWGLYYLGEDKRESYFENHYQVNEDALESVIMKGGVIWTPKMGEGADTKWNEFLDFVFTHSMEDDEAYAYVQEQFDVDAFRSYLYQEMYLFNADWPDNNIMVWRTAYEDVGNAYADGRWRYLPFDMDNTLYPRNDDKVTENFLFSDTDTSNLFLALMENEDFNRDFFDGFYEALNTEFDEERVTQYWKEEMSLVESEVKRYLNRWEIEGKEETILGIEPTFERWQNIAYDIYDFLDTRDYTMEEELDNLRDYKK